MSRFLLAVGLGGALISVPTLAFSAATEEVSDSLLEATSEQLNIDISDQELQVVLAEGLGYAIEVGIVRDDIIAAVQSSAGDGASVDISEEVAANLEQELQNWDTEFRDLVAAFEFHQDDFDRCRFSGDKTPADCAEELGLRVQLTSAECTIEKIEALKKSLVELKDEDLSSNEEMLALAESLLEKKLLRANELASGLEPGSEKRAQAESVAATIIDYLETSQ